MAEKHWKEQWEDDARAEYDKLCALPLEKLRKRVGRGKFGEHYAIWDAIAAKRDLAPVGWQLFDFVNSNADYLHRYHCARALLALLDCKEFQPADLSVAHLNASKNLARVEVLLQSAIGRRPSV